MNLITTINQLSSTEKMMIFGCLNPGHHIVELDEAEQKAIELWRKIPAENRLNIADALFRNEFRGQAHADDLAQDELNAALSKEGCSGGDWYE